MEKSPFIIDEYVRWSEVDHAGIIFYGAYVRFFEIAEAELFRDLGIPYGVVFERFDMWLPRVHLAVDFHYPARLDDRLRVATYVTKIGSTSVHLAFDVWHAGAGCLAATGTEVLVCTDRTTLRPKPIPADLHRLLERVAVEPDDARRFLKEQHVKERQ